jgi:hypothetical protein
VDCRRVVLKLTMMTRRTAIFLGLGVPALAFAPKEFWDEKDPKDWTEEERQELLTRSPWAHVATAKYNAGASGFGMMGAGGNNRRGGRTVNPGSSSAKDPAPLPKNYDAIVRWESALPIREATRNQSKDDPAANYILCVTGDLPMLGRNANDESQEAYAQRMDMLKQYTKLEKHGDPIYLVRMGFNKDGALFYFERNDLIRPGDHEVTFVTKLGPIDVKCKFAVKEMAYRGKLEL